MPTSTDMHVGDIGTVLEVTLYDSGSVVDVSSATVKQIILEKPDGTAVTKTASFTTDGADGKLRYTTIANDLDAPGDWNLQVYVEMPAGKWKSDVGVFTVLPNLS